MLIKSLTLDNFRQFTNNQTIYFSTDENKKVTFIMAESGVGKTTLIQSFKWVLYGKCNYSRILNDSVKISMNPGESKEVLVKTVINHGNRDYVITRSQKFRKINIKVEESNSVLTIDYKEENGISKQVRGRDADILIKTLMHQDLFPYFFLEGENLTKVGEQMSRGKTGTNSDFRNAIKGLLGFNHLYETTKHLDIVSRDYSNEIAKNTSNDKLKHVLEEINKCDETIKKAQERISTIETEIIYNEEKRNELSDKIMVYGEVEAKQKRTKVLTVELSSLKSKIEDRKKQIFKKFSSNSFYAVIDSLLGDIQEALKNSDSMDKGIPGMNIEAVKYMLNNHLCICGEKLIEGSEHWQKLVDLITFLPPNNIGYELKTFSNELQSAQRQASNFDDDFIRERKALLSDIKEYDDKLDELNKLNEEIGNVREDIGFLKNQEQEYNSKIVSLNFEKHNKEEVISNVSKRKEEFIRDKETYQKRDYKTKQYQAYYLESEMLKTRILRYISRKEKEVREKLSQAINNIFKDFYDEKITFSVDSNYGIQIKTLDKELSDDFTSGGQDVAIALAFIGAIIKLSGEKNTDQDDIEEEEEKEPYPLVMDAPTSNFGMRQMKSFSDIMPKITDQIIVFINDKDGPILHNLMLQTIGSQWLLYQEKGDSFHTQIIREGN